MTTTPHSTPALANRIRIESVETLSDDWYVPKKTTFRCRRRDGTWQRQSRETYDRGNGATILLCDLEARTLVLVRQFRYPAFINGCDDLLIETPAGLLDNADPEARTRAQTEEETGFRIGPVERVFEAYMSPGSITERRFFFVASHKPADRVSAGGGDAGEGEEIDLFELTIEEALATVEDGRIQDGKTIMSLQHAALHLSGKT